MYIFKFFLEFFKFPFDLHIALRVKRISFYRYTMFAVF